MAHQGHTADQRIDVDYCRISLDKNGAGEGVDSQHQENEDLANDVGWRLARTYVDNDVSAYSGAERSDYVRLCRDIEADQVRSVTFWHANRLHRNIDEASTFLKVARKHGVRLLSVAKGSEYNLNRTAGRQEFLSDTLKAQGESEERGDRVALARKRQARTGAYGGGVRPYGFGVDTGRVRSVCVNPKAPPMERVYEDRPVLDMTRARPDEAAEIRKWADDVLAGVSLRHVLLDLQRRGVQTVSQKDGRVVKRNGKQIEPRWNVRTLRSILTHPRVSGHSEYKGEITRRNVYEQILPDDTREALITLFNDPSRKTRPSNTPKWLGSLVLRCGVCNDGTAMVCRYNSGGHRVYACRASGHCRREAAPVDDYLIEAVVHRLARSDVADLVDTRPDVDAGALRTELAVLQQRKQDAALQFAQGHIDAAMMATITAELDKRITDINTQLTAAASHSPLMDFAGVTDTSQARQLWEGLTLGRKREVLRELADVTLLPLGRGRRPKNEPAISPETVVIDWRKPPRAA